MNLLVFLPDTYRERGAVCYLCVSEGLRDELGDGAREAATPYWWVAETMGAVGACPGCGSTGPGCQTWKAKRLSGTYGC